MTFGKFFIDRPRFAAVVSILITIVGMLAYFGLPVTQYPEVAPPQIVVTATYPGANAETIADTVATPIEQEVNGVEDMLYLTSSSTADGVMNLRISFKLGTDLDTAQVLVQNRVARAEPRLPEEVRRLGVVTQKSSPDLMMVVHLLSPDESFDQLYISNYAILQIRDVLARIDGVGDIQVFGAREYAMRVWLDPERLASLNLTASDVVQALRGQNVQVAGGALGLPPNPEGNAFQLSVNALGRLSDIEQFRQVIVAAEGNRVVRLGEVARVELGAQAYSSNSYLDGKPAIAIGIYQRPGSNALDTAKTLRSTVAELAKEFPTGLAYDIVYDPTEFVAESINEVIKTIFEAVALVVLVMVLFLQSWRAAIIPIVAIPVSLIGTFAVMQALGFSLNNLSLFGLVLAIGIVVDDAIVVIENMERNLADGMSPRDAARTTMDEVGTAIIAMTLVLVAVFVPTAFLGGISGQFFRQFAVTISVATVISAFNSLTLSPALGALLLKPHDETKSDLLDRVAGGFFRLFNRGFDRAGSAYGGAVCWFTRRAWLALTIFAALLIATALLFRAIPAGFIPQQDQGYLIVAIELPKGASLERTDDVVLRATDIILETPGAAHAVGFAGFSGATFAAASNAAAIFVPLKPFKERGSDLGASAVQQQLQGRLMAIKEAQVFVIAPPPIRGLGTGSGFKLQVQDRRGRGLEALQGVAYDMMGAANQMPEASQVFTLFSTQTPQYFAEIDRAKAEMLGVPVQNVFDTLEIFLGSAFVNDFNLFGRTYRVTAQADAQYRLSPRDIEKLRTRNIDGEMVPLGSIMDIRDITGADRVVRHNLYPTAELQGEAAPGYSSGEAISAMEELAQQRLPTGFGYEWTEIAYQQTQASNVGILIFPLCVLFVFLLLTAQYENWSLPLAIILIVPLSILFALVGVGLRGMDNNILTQIGFIVLVGLASKNAILIVEFAKQQEDRGKSIYDAATNAAQLRLRPIIMTAMAFILGVVPLVIASGPGAEMRQALGTAVFAGMIGVTIVGLFLTPVFYTVVRGLTGGRKQALPEDQQEPGPEPEAAS